MSLRMYLREHAALYAYLAKWLAITTALGIVVGSAVALFLWSLERATVTRFEYPWLLFLLPLGGLGIGLMYHYFGRSVEGGNNLILDQIHEPNGGVPLRMAPLVLIGTVLTHLFGGSAGREGTAVQMGGSMAARIGTWLGLSTHDARILLMAGVAAGFGAVFGTPLAGAVFAMEVLAIGRMSYESLLPCLAASVIGDVTVRGWGIAHSHYYITSVISSAASSEALSVHSPLTLLLMTKVIIAAIAFGLAAVLFADLTHRLHKLFAAIVPWPVVRPVLGGLLVIGLVFLLGTRDYLGLGTNADPATPHAVTIQSCFSAGGATPWSWWWKILFTAVTLSSGFKGGEVTPLFFIGAALGNALAQAMGAPVDLFAGLGFVAVFAGATNTPLACTIMGLELFLPNSPGLLNSGFGIYLPVACFLAYLVSGHSGIYSSQRIGMPKIDSPDLLPDTPLHVAREIRRVAHDQSLIRPSSRSVPQTSTAHPEGDVMSHPTRLGTQDIGQLRIFLTARERRNKGFRGLFGKPVYQEIIHAAKQDGVLNAVAHRMQFGYSGQGKIETDKHEIPNEYLTLCVELIGERPELETFCQKHAALLFGKVVVYEKLERWEVGALVATDASPPDVDEEAA
ncbi:MAG TPA: voltage-gated chloride channel family protein [Planctomycetaceae bacterium]|jgi:H+/Cl- antiporter ClcA/PII-like signaling protein|nr:voltage-gated chloride channel family protein [Planctomycetaceae bacterium]